MNCYEFIVIFTSLFVSKTLQPREISPPETSPVCTVAIETIRFLNTSTSAMSEALKRAGIYFDEVDKVRILDPNVSKETNNLKDECRAYVEKIDEFQKISDGFISLVEKLGHEVDGQKINAIGARNVLQTMEKQKEANQQQLQALMVEKSMELERLKILLNSLQKTEMEQNEIINRLTHN